MPALRTEGIAIAPAIWGWGTYLPDAVAALRSSPPELVHLHWPEALCHRPLGGPGQRLLRRILRIARGADREREAGIEKTIEALQELRRNCIKIVWTLHNLAPHDTRTKRTPAYERLYQQFAAGADAALHHSAWGMQKARQILPFRPDCLHETVPFGFFPDEAPETLTKAQARQELHLPADALVLLTVGSAGPRKHLDLLVDGVLDTNDFPCLLVVVGNCQAVTAREFTERSQGRVRFEGQLSQGELSRRARAADFLLFAPDPDLLTTGGPHLSESFRLPQISAAHPYTQEILGTTAIYFEPTAAELKTALAAARRLLRQDQNAYRAIQTRLEEQRRNHRWQDAARRTAAMYRALLAQSGTPAKP